MGGGGGTGPSGIRDMKSLIDKAKKELHKSEQEGRKNVFISFTFEDIKDVNMLRAHAKNENSPIEFNDWSVSDPIDSDKATYIKKKISERIEKSSLTVVYLSAETPKSKWIEWEIEESLNQGKKVIGVFKGDKPPGSIPDIITKNKIKCVPWSKLAETIDKL